MSQFCTCSTSGTACPPDPTKHVNFVEGMVLGVDDFTQEFAYHQDRDRSLARDLIGYGTVSGLRLFQRGPTATVELGVTAGEGLTPCGDVVRVCSDQCASLNEWLTRAADAGRPMEEQLATHVELIGSLPERWVRLQVVLRYQDCETDPVGILGEPCRSDAESVAASRRKDSFRLELRFQPSRQREELAIRDVVQWLRGIPVITETPSDPGSTVAEVLAALRASATEWTSPPSPPSPPSDFLLGSPPAFLAIPRSQAGEYWREVFRVWVTELRPLWQLRCGGCGETCSCTTPSPTADPGGAPEPWLWLGEVRIPLSNSNQVRDAALIEIDDRQRPYVLHLRLIQEWILGRLSDEVPLVNQHSALGGLSLGDDHPQYLTNGRGDARYSPLGHTHDLDALADVSTAGAAENQVLTRVGGQWVAQTPASGVTAHGALTGLGVGDDHPQYLTNGRGDARYSPLGHTHDLDALSDVSTAGALENQVLTRVGGQWVAQTPATGVTDHGGLTGLIDDDHPQYLTNGRGDVRYSPLGHTHALSSLGDVSISGASAGQVLTFDGSRWTAQPVSGGPAQGDFVSRRSDSQFGIAAAGIVRLGRARSPGYGGLRVVRVEPNDPGVVVLTFAGYITPAGRHQYIVKALAVGTGKLFPTVCFGRFLDGNEGFTLEVGLGDSPMDPERLARLELMIEVSEFGTDLPGFDEAVREGREPIRPDVPVPLDPLRGRVTPTPAPVTPVPAPAPTPTPIRPIRTPRTPRTPRNPQ